MLYIFIFNNFFVSLVNVFLQLITVKQKVEIYIVIIIINSYIQYYDVIQYHLCVTRRNFLLFTLLCQFYSYENCKISEENFSFFLYTLFVIFIDYSLINIYSTSICTYLEKIDRTRKLILGINIFKFDQFQYLYVHVLLACPPGYIGINCSIECRFPSYGDHCQSECNCSKENCSVSTGCPNNGQRTNTITGVYQIV